MFRRKRERIIPYLPRLMGYAKSLAGDPETARELVQEAACKALASRRTPRDEPAYRAWLFRILRNQYIDELRRRGRDQRRLEEFGSAETLSMEYWQGDERLINKVTVRAAMERIKPGQAEILALIDIAGLSYQEAADVIGVPAGTVMSRLSRARAALLYAIEGKGAQVVELSKRRNRREHG